MGSLSTPKLPVIEFTKENLEPGTNSWSSTCNNVRQVLEEYGCFVAVYDKVSLDLHNEIFDVVKDLFDLPLETKMKNTSDIPYYGYAGVVPRIYEGLGIDAANTLEGTTTFTNVMWPEGNDHFCKTALEYSRLVIELEQMVRKMVLESYGVEKYYDSQIASCNYLLRLMRYEGPDTKENELRLDVHSDKSFITILHQNEVSGLEIETKDGDWIGFEPSASSFVVMAGDAFLAWSNGRIHSPKHRVVMKGSKTRYSLGLFTFDKGIIQIPEELVDDEHPLRFKPFDHYGLLRYYVTKVANQAPKDECTAILYCGV